MTSKLLQRVIQLYKAKREIIFSRKYLLYTNMTISMSISALGDFIEQTYELHTQSIRKFDAERSSHVCFSGLVAGILTHNWYIFLDNVIDGRTIKHMVKKLLLDQFICSPILILSFFATVAIFEDHPLEQFDHEVRDKFITLYKAEWVVWPPAQIINFYFLPTKYRVAYDNAISLGYDIYTSQVKYASHKKKYQEEHKQDTSSKEQ